MKEKGRLRGRLAIIGAGPKALALAAKNAILSELGFETPEIHIFEKNGVGANWNGKNGFTNGKLHLGTSPEKDIGFPYQSKIWTEKLNAEVDRRMLRFSWLNFLIAQGRYSEWIDRGRPAPCHGQWARYLQWVAGGLQKDAHLHYAQVTSIKVQGEFWELTYVAEGVHRSNFFDGVVSTGPGKPKSPVPLPNDPRIFSIENFWKALPHLKGLGSKRIALVGTGENAASIAMVLASQYEGIDLNIIAPHGMAFSRGESFQENSVYSDPLTGKWSLLTDEDKRQFISRTDRGVFSQYANQVLSRGRRIEFIPGRVEHVNISDAGPAVVWSYNDRQSGDSFDYVIVAAGSDQAGFLREMMDHETLEQIGVRAQLKAFEDAELESKIDIDMSLNGIYPKLHLPMLSGIRQGPGFANLSCLGALSDRILCPYARVTKTKMAAPSLHQSEARTLTA